MSLAPDTCVALIDELGGADDWRERRFAALRLARFPGEESFAALAAALGDRDHDVRHAVVQSLGASGDPRAVELLCRPMVLEDDAVEIRWAAITALGHLGNLSLASVIARALDDSEWVVRNQALLAISDLIRKVPETVDGEQVKDLIRLLAIADREVHELVVDALSRRSTRGLDEMVEAMKLKSRMVRAGVAEALGLSRDPRAVAPLIAATRDPVGVVRAEAARGLGRLGDPWAVEALVVLLGDGDSAVCQAAVKALVAIGEPAVEALCTVLDHSLSKTHRRNVILTLGGIRDQRAVLPLLNSLSSTYYLVRQAAITALSAFGDSVVADLIPLTEVSQVPIDDLLGEALENPTTRLQLRAVRALGEIKNAAAIRPLRLLMRHPDPTVVQTTQEALSKIGLAAWARYGAVIALGNVGSSAAIPALTRALADHHTAVRVEAARALAKVGGTDAVAALLVALEGDEESIVRREAAAALRQLWVKGLGVTKAFRLALADPSWEVRAEAARALGRIDDEASVEPLLAALQDSSYTVSTFAEHAVANLGKLALPQLLDTAAGPPSPRLEAALRALAEVVGGDQKGAVAALAEASQDERRRWVEATRVTLES